MHTAPSRTARTTGLSSPSRVTSSSMSTRLYSRVTGGPPAKRSWPWAYSASRGSTMAAEIPSASKACRNSTNSVAVGTSFQSMIPTTGRSRTPRQAWKASSRACTTDGAAGSGTARCVRWKACMAGSARNAAVRASL